MSTTNQHKVRAVSARPPLGRPVSGKYRKMHQKTQFIENVYANPTPNNYHSFQKNKIFSMRSNMPETDQEDMSKLIPKSDKIIKDREELLEQNLHLKKEINRLKDQLSKNRTKIETLSSKNYKYTKQLNRQFEKKMYWNGPNSYMISGIKAQYQKLRQQFQQKEMECSQYKRQLIQSKAPEFKIYAETLQEQNKKLVQRITKMSEISEQILFDNEGEKIIPEYLYLELAKKKQKVQEKLQETSHRLKNSRQDVKQLRRKIEFLEKLIIQKDNSQYHATKKAKKLEREKNQLYNQVEDLRNKAEQESRNNLAKLEKLKQVEQRKFQTQKSMFDRTLIEKDLKISKLQKQVAYLSTLLTYWKPLDQINRQIGDRINDDDDLSEQKGGSQIENINDEQNLNMANSKRPRKPSEFKINNSMLKFDGMNSSRQLDPLQKQEKIARIQQTADEKHSQEAEKKRKVDVKQVQHLGEHLRYRMLGLKMPLNEARRYFNFNKDSKKQQKQQFILNENNEQQNLIWEEEYITMQETKEILQQHPFQLTEQDAHLLSRYLIQDSNKDYVYCDLKNQHKRSIVKSIMRSLLGDYEVFNEQKQAKVEQQCNNMMERYQSNILSALSTMASAGFISRKKFIELLQSLGIELSEAGKDYLICKMLLKSQSLNKLQYMILF